MYYKYAYPELFDGIPRPDFQAYSGNLVIYGAGFQGLLAAYLLDKQGIKVLCFCDQNVRKQGTIYYGLPVYSPEEMVNRYPDAVAIVSPYNLRPAYQYVRNDLGYGERTITPFSIFLDFDSSGFDSLPQLPEWYHPSSLDYTIDMFLKQCINLLTNYQFLATDISVSEICNLRCKNCTSLMPCYQNPRSFAYEDVLRDLQTVLQKNKKYYIYVEGGEPFIWEPLPQLLCSIRGFPEVLGIYVITNGTLIPNSELLKALRHPKIGVRISDYGEVSKKEQLISLFEMNHIRYWVQLQKWFELSVFQKTSNSGRSLQQVLDDCCKATGCGAAHIVDGKLYRCPIQANLHKLGIFTSSEKDYVDLRNSDSQQLEDRLSRFMNVKRTPPIVELCRHCNGRGYNGIEVPPAEQLAPGEKIQVRFE